jgi:hypothetical protein
MTVEAAAIAQERLILAASRKELIAAEKVKP